MKKSAYAGRGLANRLAESQARLDAIHQQKLDYLDSLAKQRTQQPTIATQEQERDSFQIDPLDDPESNLSRHLSSLGLDKDKYLSMSVLKRQRDVIDPLIEQQWQQEVVSSPELSSLAPEKFNRIRDDYFNQRRNVYRANFANVEAKETGWSKLGNLASDIAEGAVDTVAAVGDVAKVFGNDNWFSSGIDKVTDSAKEFLNSSQSEAEQQREELLNEYLSNGEWGKAGSLAKDNGLMVAGEIGKVFGGVGGYGALTKGTAKLAGKGLSKAGAVKVGEKVADTGAKLSTNMPAYAALSGGGQTAQELHDRGIDIDTPAGIGAVVTSALGNALVTKMLPHNAESALIRAFRDKGVSELASKQAAQAVVDKLTHGGFFSKSLKTAGRFAGNALKAGGSEAVEEYGQEGISALMANIIKPDGTLMDSGEFRQAVDEGLLEKVHRRAAAGAAVGLVAGGGIGAGLNINRYGSTKISQEAKAAQAELNKYAAEELAAKKAQERVRSMELDDIYDVDENGDYVEKDDTTPEVRAWGEELLRRREAELQEVREAERAKREEMETFLAEQEKRNAELDNYGVLKAEAMSVNNEPINVVKQKLDTLTERVVDAIAIQQSADVDGGPTDEVRQRVRNSITGNQDRVASLARHAQLVGLDISEDIKDVRKQISENKKLFSGRTAGIDGLWMKSNERENLVKAIRTMTDGELDINQNDIVLPIDIEVDERYAELMKATLQAIKDNNGQLAERIHRSVNVIAKQIQAEERKAVKENRHLEQPSTVRVSLDDNIDLEDSVVEQTEDLAEPEAVIDTSVLNVDDNPFELTPLEVKPATKRTLKKRTRVENVQAVQPTLELDFDAEQTIPVTEGNGVESKQKAPSKTAAKGKKLSTKTEKTTKGKAPAKIGKVFDLSHLYDTFTTKDASDISAEVVEEFSRHATNQPTTISSEQISADLYRAAFEEHDGQAMVEIVQKVRSKVFTHPSSKNTASVGDGIIANMLRRYGVLNQVGSITEFVQQSTKTKLNGIIKYADKWLEANPRKDGNTKTARELNATRLSVIALQNTIKAHMVSSKSDKASKLASVGIEYDINNETLGEGLRNVFAERSARVILGSIKSYLPKGSLQSRVVEAYRQRAVDNDITVELLTSEQMYQQYGANVKGVFDPTTEKVYIADNLSFTQTVDTFLHEITHAYLNKTSSKWFMFNEAYRTDNNINPSDYDLTADEVKLMTDTEQMMDNVRGHEAYLNPRYNVNLVESEQGMIAYGLSFADNDVHQTGEFLAELFSSEGFRRATADALASRQKSSFARALHKVRNILRNIAELFGFKTEVDNKAVTDLIEHGLRVADTVPFSSLSHGLSFVKADREFKTQIERDEKRGIQFYTFKSNHAAVGHSNGIASAYRNNETGLWSFQTQDENSPTGYTTVENINTAQLAEQMIKYNLVMKSRNGNTRMSTHISQTMERFDLLYPQVAKILTKLHQLFMTFTGEDNANAAIEWMTNKALWFEHSFLNRDAIHTWMSRAIQKKYPDNPELWVDLQREVAILSAQYNNEFVERGIDRMTVYDHITRIEEFAKQVGWDKHRLQQVTYALMARTRAEQFSKEKGEIDPYTGKYVRDSSAISGFRFNGQEDTNAEKFFAAQSAEELGLIKEFEQMWIMQNDTVLDLEYASGVLSTERYNAMKGTFYAPLRTEGDVITAFIKRATGRSTEAQNPFTTWYELAQARVQFTLKQKEMSLLVDLAQDHGLNDFIQVNQTYTTVNSDNPVGYEWRSNNLMDGSTMVVYKNGQRYTLTITDPKIREIYKKHHSWKQRSAFWDTIAGITRAMSAVRTSLSVSYIPAAFARDLASAMINTQLAFRTTTGGQILTDAEAQQLSTKIVAKAIPSAFSILKGKWSGNRQWQYDVFKRMGGGIVMNARLDSEQWNHLFEKSITPEARSTKNILRDTGKTTLRKVLDISHSFEDAVRFATFIEYVKMRAGRDFNNETDLISYLQSNPTTKTEAISASKNITGNFETKGANVPIRSMFMFFNAGMVGAQTATHMFNGRHGNHAMNTMKIIASMSLASLAFMDAELGDDDDGKSKSSRVSMTENAICAGMSGCIQLPHEVRWISSTMKGIYEYGKGDISLGEAVAMSMRGITQIGSPFSFGDIGGENTGAAVAMGLVPTIAQLPLQLLTNQDAFGRDITPEFAYDGSGKRIMNAQDWQRYKLSDPDWAKAMAMYGQKWFGIDNSASQYVHTANFLLGGIYNAGKKFARGVEQQKPALETFWDIVGSGFTPRYNEMAQVYAVREQLREMKASLSMGDSVDNMLRSTSDLKGDSKYAKLVELEKWYEKTQKAILYEGKSYAEFTRQKMTGEQTGDVDAILDANTGLDYHREMRRELAGEMLMRLLALQEEINDE